MSAGAEDPDGLVGVLLDTSDVARMMSRCIADRVGVEGLVEWLKSNPAGVWSGRMSGALSQTQFVLDHVDRE